MNQANDCGPEVRIVSRMKPVRSIEALTQSSLEDSPVANPNPFPNLMPLRFYASTLNRGSLAPKFSRQDQFFGPDDLECRLHISYRRQATGSVGPGILPRNSTFRLGSWRCLPLFLPFTFQ